MPVLETSLPGVGTKYTIELTSGEQIVVVVHRVGHRELVRVDADGVATPLLELDEHAAAEIGRVLCGAEEKREDERMQMLLRDFSIEWVRIEAGSPLVGQTLRGAGIRETTGASVIAILRGEESVPSPPPDATVEEDDTLVIVGRREQVEAFVSRYATPDTAA